jgi:hypothetical protein
MRIPFTLRILLVLAGLACLIGPALRPTSSPGGDLSIAVVRGSGAPK